MAFDDSRAALGRPAFSSTGFASDGFGRVGLCVDLWLTAEEYAAVRRRRGPLRCFNDTMERITDDYEKVGGKLGD